MITLKDLSFGYGLQSTVFTDLSLAIPQGHCVGILGANGVGKTTLIKLIAGLVTPTAGSLSVMGFTPRQRKTAFFQNVYVVPEEPELPPMTAFAYVDHFSVFYPAFEHQRFHTLAQAFGIETDKKLTTLSLGNKKKFLLAFAMSTGCQLVLMDEPTNGLDITAKAQFRDMVVKYQSEQQAILICTHQVRELGAIIDSVVMLNQQHAHWFDLGLLPERISQVTASAAPEDVLYAETRMGSPLALVKGGQHHATDIDLELLLNAFHTNYDGLIAAVHKEEA